MKCISMLRIFMAHYHGRYFLLFKISLSKNYFVDKNIFRQKRPPNDVIESAENVTVKGQFRPTNQVTFIKLQLLP